MRSVSLHESALSPSEYEQWHAWWTFASQQESMEPQALLQLAHQATKAASTARDEEIIKLMRPHKPMGSPEFLAMLRLIDHSRTCATLCKDHIYIQSPNPIALAQVPTNTAQAKSNPFLAGRRITSDPPASWTASLRPPMDRARAVSAQLNNNPFTKCTASSPPSSPATVTAGPPLPPRKPVPPPPKREAPLSRSATLPTRPKQTMNIIHSSEHLSNPTRVSQESLFGSGTAHPKPKLVKSSHIDPSTNLRPLSKSIPHAETDDIRTVNRHDHAEASTSSSSSSGGAASGRFPRERTSSAATTIPENSRAAFKPPIPPKRRPGSFMLPSTSSRALHGPLSAVSAPGPPHHRIAHSRSSSASFGTLARNRPLDEILGPGMERTQEWVNASVLKAKRHIEAHVGSSNERKGLIKDGDDYSINENESEEGEDRDGFKPGPMADTGPSRDVNGWQRL